MFTNPFRKDMTNQTGAINDDNPQLKAAPSDPGVQVDDAQVWTDKIRAAAFDDVVLLQLAHQAPTVELKLAALNALTHESALKQAMREFRDHDKRLHRLARTRWLAASNKRIALAEAGALLANARALLEQESVSANRIVELDRAWAALDSELLDAALPTEFVALREQLAAKARAHGEGEQAIVRWLATSDAAIAQLQASLPGVAQGDALPATVSALAANLLGLIGDVPDALDMRCNSKSDTANRTLALASSVVQRAEFLQLLPASGTIDETDEKLKIEQWRAFPEVFDKDLQAVLARRFADWRNAGSDERQREHEVRRAKEQETGTEERKLRLDALRGDVESAEAAQAAGSTADLTRLMAQIERVLKSGAANTTLMRRIDALRQEQKRLRDWQRWSGKQGREQLVAEAQALSAAAAGKVAVKTHGEAIDKLRDRWKELDKLGGATNQTLWLAFDGALKAAYAPVAAHLDKLKAARNENLAAREKIVEELTQAAARLLPVAIECAAPAPGSPDLRALARAIEDAQVAWRKLGPVEHTVPRKAQKGENAITTRYARAMQVLETPLADAYRSATLEREQLIAAAKGLAGVDAMARDALDKVRALQSRWQANAKSLALPRRDENRLWAEFKTATDAIFVARDAARAAREAEFSAKFKEREDIIGPLATLTPASKGPDIKRAMAEAETAWRAAAEVPKPQAVKLEARYRAARDSAGKLLAQLAANVAQARYDALIAKMELCQERELAADAGAGLDAENAAELEARWSAVENFPDVWKSALDGRFRGPASVQADMKPLSGSADSLADLLLKLEVACGLESPGEFSAARQALKLRALKQAMEGRQATVTTPADIERWLLSAAAVPRPDDGSRVRLLKIISAVRVRR